MDSLSQRAPVLALFIAVGACDRAPGYEAPPLPAGALELRDVGFQTPESVLHDSLADVYLVSNINGGGRDRDDNGFISRVSPDGQLIELKWIDGADANVSLSAPKGSAIIGDSLFVTDIDSIRVFDRNTGAPLRSFSVPNATALNDLAVAVDGALWVSDMGSPEMAARTGVHRIAPGGEARLVATGEEIDGPNGLLQFGDSVLVASYRGNELVVANAERVTGTFATVSGSRLDGLVHLPDGSVLVSSWDAMAIFRTRAGGQSAEVLFDNLRSPADIGYDARRNRLLVPSFDGGWLRIYPLQ